LDKLPIFKQSRNKKETKTERIENKRKEIQIPKKKSKNKEEKKNQKRLFTPSLTSFSLLTPQSLPIYSIFFPPTNHPVLWLQNTLLILKVNTGAKNPSQRKGHVLECLLSLPDGIFKSVQASSPTTFPLSKDRKRRKTTLITL